MWYDFSNDDCQNLRMQLAKKCQTSNKLSSFITVACYDQTMGNIGHFLCLLYYWWCQTLNAVFLHVSVFDAF